ncbi:MAG: glycosyltransferase family 4 protein [Euryarchaeota archaeon]|nr:glycosyltransferase family 4 protein [Euryarchaeota archaeon]
MQIAQCYFRFLHGGIEEHILNLSEEIKTQGHSVDLIAGGWLRKDAPMFPLKETGYANFPLLRKYSFASKASKYLKDFDLVHCHDWSSALAAQEAEVPYVLTCHTFYPYKSWKNLLFKYFLKKALSKAKGIIATNNFVKEGLNREYNVEAEVIPNGVTLKEFYRSKSEPFILFVGRLSPEKGLRVLVKAFDAICKKRNDVNLKIVGDGPLKLELIEYSKKNPQIEICGYITKDELRNLYSRCSFLVLPSVIEDFGVVLLEAQASSKPVISTNAGGISEIVQHKRTGLLVKQGDVKELVEAMLLLINDEKLRENMGAQARSFVEQFDWGKIASKIVKVYEEAIKR